MKIKLVTTRTDMRARLNRKIRMSGLTPQTVRAHRGRRPRGPLHHQSPTI